MDMEEYFPLVPTLMHIFEMRRFIESLGIDASPSREFEPSSENSNEIGIEKKKNRLTVEIPPPDGLVRVFDIDGQFSDLNFFYEIQFDVFVYLCIVPFEQQLIDEFPMKPHVPLKIGDPVCGCKNVSSPTVHGNEYKYDCYNHSTRFVVHLGEFPYRNTVLMCGCQALLDFSQLEKLIEYRDAFQCLSAAEYHDRLYEGMKSVCCLDFDLKITYASYVSPDEKKMEISGPFRPNEQARLFVIDQLNYLPPIGKSFHGGYCYRNLDPEKTKDYGIRYLKDLFSDAEEKEMKQNFGCKWRGLPIKARGIFGIPRSAGYVAIRFSNLYEKRSVGLRPGLRSEDYTRFTGQKMFRLSDAVSSQRAGQAFLDRSAELLAPDRQLLPRRIRLQERRSGTNQRLRNFTLERFCFGRRRTSNEAEIYHRKIRFEI